MRTIDADELKTAFPCGERVTTECVRATIDNMPTIEPERKAHWIPVSEQLPEDGEYVWVKDKGKKLAMYHSNGNEFSFDFECFAYVDPDDIEWMSVTLPDI